MLPSADIDLHDTSTLLPSDSCAPNPLGCDRGIVKKAGSRDSNVSRMSRVSHCHNHHFIRSERIDTIRMWSMLMVNVLIVGSVNGFYIYSTLQAYSPESNVLIQYAGIVLVLILILNGSLTNKLSSCSGIVQNHVGCFHCTRVIPLSPCRVGHASAPQTFYAHV